MKYVNSWAYELSAPLPAGEDSLPLPGGALTALGIEDGDVVVLTITATLNPLEQSAFEFVRLTGTGGGINVERGALGTSDEAWAAGAVIYAALPAEQLNDWTTGIADLLARVVALEAGGGGGGGGSGIGVGPAPIVAPAALGEAILAPDGTLWIGRNTGDINGWDRFARVVADISSTDDALVLDAVGAHQVRGTWSPVTQPELQVPGWVVGESVHYRLLLIYAGANPLIISGALGVASIYCNLAATDNEDGTISVPLTAPAMWITVERAGGGPWVILAEPLALIAF